MVREDPRRRGLLYAGTETGVYVSFDDGAAWQSLRLNMPVVSVHDISVHGDDLAIATHGRAFWILDDVAPLRQLAANAAPDARLFAPRDAVRTRPYNDEAESSPPEVPMGENPPYGAPIDYVVPAGERGRRRARDRERGGPHRARVVEHRRGHAGRSQQRRVSRVLARAARAAFGRARNAPLRVGLPRRDDGDGTPPPRRRRTVRAARALHGAPHRRRSHVIQPLLVRRDPRIHATDADLVAQYALARDVDALLARVQRGITQAADARKKPGADVAKIDAIAGAPAGARCAAGISRR